MRYLLSMTIEETGNRMRICRSCTGCLALPSTIPSTIQGYQSSSRMAEIAMPNMIRILFRRYKSYELRRYITENTISNAISTKTSVPKGSGRPPAGMQICRPVRYRPPKLRPPPTWASPGHLPSNLGRPADIYRCGWVIMWPAEACINLQKPT